MKYTVLWSAAAERNLAQLWLDAVDRDAIRRAADDVDDVLSRNPSHVGESRQPPARVTLIAPLGVEFKVRESDKTAIVLSVWVPRRRGST